MILWCLLYIILFILGIVRLNELRVCEKGFMLFFLSWGWIGFIKFSDFCCFICEENMVSN